MSAAKSGKGEEATASAAGGEASASIEESNRLRASLGLRPLQPNAEEKVKHLPAGSVQKAPTAEDLAEAEDAAERARAREILIGGPSLSQLVEDVDLDPMSWVRATKRKRARGQFGLGQVALDAGAAPQADRGGEKVVRVDHDLQEFDSLDSGTTKILTLKDQPLISSVAGEASLLRDSEEADVLEEVGFREKNRESELRDRKREAAMSANQRLAMVDEKPSAAKRSFKIRHDAENLSADIVEPHESEETMIGGWRRRAIGTEIDLTTSKIGVQSDYYNSSEMAGFSKPVVPRQIRKKPKRIVAAFDTDDDLTRPTEEAAGRDGAAADVEMHATGGAGVPTAADGDGDDAEDVDDRILYEHLSQQLKASRRERFANQPSVVVVEEMLKEELEVKNEGGVAVKKEESGDAVGLIKEEDKGLHLTSTTEFCRSIKTPLEKMESVKREAYSGAQLLRNQLLVSAEGSGGAESQSSSGAPRASSSSASGAAAASADGEDEEAADGEWEELSTLEELGHEKILGMSVSDALQRLKDRGELDSDVFRVSRKNKQCRPMHMSTDPEDIKLENKDDFGRVMTQKEAFRHISWIFHGKGPGKKKREAMLRKMELEKRLRKANPAEEAKTMKALRKSQQQHDQAHLVLSHLG